MSTTSAPSGTQTSLNLKNVLDGSRSPYVRGHMNNPVAWQMWGPEAIEMAKKHNRLLFVSIGYAACHWCHVMEREAFENHEIASVLNASFVPIKVDREERPDVDRIYMNYVQATTGHGGWPLNVFITPDLEPVYGGTYWPGPESAMVTQGGHIGFLGILRKIKALWEEQPEKCLLSAKSITAQLKEFAQEGTLGGSKSSAEDSEGLELDLLEEAYDHYESKYDTTYGGFGGAPKFPTPANLSFLILLSQFQGPVQELLGEDAENAKGMVLNTLRNMTRGGIHDQIGHGFARYSVTKDWSLPHFEKMLYDQGQLLSVYLDAFLVTGDAEMLGAVYDIATYLTTPPLAAPNGGFYSAEDADSYNRAGDKEKREGAFYVWTYKEFVDILGEQDAKICAKFWNVKEKGNVSPEHDAHDELTNQNVLAISASPESLAKEFSLTKDEVVKVIKEARAKLLDHRNKERPPPLLDDKIVAGWNGLAIGALARASSVLESIPGAELAQECKASAVRAAAFIKKELFDTDSQTLKRVYRDGPGDAPAFADDYAFLIQGLIELYEATFDDQHLAFADALQRTQNRLFLDTARTPPAGFYSTQADQPDMILRLKDGLDNAEPSTNGVAASNLFRLGSLLADEEYTKLARATVGAFATEIAQHPFLFSSMFVSVVAMFDNLEGKAGGMRSLVVCGAGEDVESAICKSRLRLKPNTTVVRLGGEARSEWLTERNQLLKSMDRERKMVQVCEGGVCRDVVDLAMMDKALLREF